MNIPLKIFITYSHKDSDAKDELITCLAGLKRDGLIKIWHDNEILAGDNWRNAIFNSLAESDILLYLASPHSLDSENCNKELAEALKKSMRVIPIILKDCDWKDYNVSVPQSFFNGDELNDFQNSPDRTTVELSNFLALPDKGLPLNEWVPESKGWQNVVEGIRRVINKMRIQTKPASKTTNNKRIAEWVFQQGNFLFMLKQMDKSIQAYSDAIDLNPDNANVHNNRGAAYGSQREYKKAVEDFTRAITLDPHNASAYNNRGLVLYKSEIDKAIKDYSKAIELNPDFASAYINRGVANYYKGKYCRAIDDYNKAIELNPGEVLAYNNRGLAYNLKGESDRAIEDYNEVIRRKPNYAEAYYNRSAAYGNKSEVDLVIKDCNKAIELKPDHAGAYRNRGVAYYEKGEVNKAIEDFTKVIQLNRNNAETYYLRASAYYKIGEIDFAIKDYTAAIELKSDYVDAYRNRGTAYNKKDQFDKAINDFSAAIALNRNDADLYQNRGTAYGKKDQFDKAINDFNAAIALKPNYISAYINRGTAYVKKDDLQLAIIDFNKAIELNPNDAEVYYYRGSVYRSKGEYNKAIENFSDAIELNPELVGTYIDRSEIYNEKGEFDKAIEDLNRVIELNPELAEAYVNRGGTYNEKGEFDKAIEDLNRAIELNPKLAEAYVNRGNAYSRKDNFQNAIENYNIAIKLKPDLAETYANRGNVYSRKGDFQNAIENYNIAIKLKPDLAEAYHLRGNIYNSKGMFEKAIKDYNTATELNPNFDDAYNNRGVAYIRMGKVKRAIEDYDTAIQLKPDYAETYCNRGEAWLCLKEWDKAKVDLIAARKMGVDIIASFHNDYKNVEAFEKRHSVKLPDDIALLLTQRRRTRYPKTQKVLDADGNPVESPNVVNLRAQLRNIGTPLGEYIKSKLSFGINTAPTEAFVIDKATRDKLIAADPSSTDVLKPFLHGQELRRWHVDPPHQWLIFVHRRIAINDYPAVLKHLEKYREVLRKRKGKQKWYELQASLRDAERFAQPKLVCPNIYNHQTFAVDTAGYYYGKTAYLIPTEETWLCGLLNSRTVEWFYSQVSNQLTIDPIRARSGYIQQIPIPDLTSTQKALIAKIVDYLIYLQQQPTINSKDLAHARDRVMLGYFERIIDGLVYEVYLSEDLHKADKHFFQPLLDEQLPSCEEIQGDKMIVLRDIFELLYERTHLVRRDLYYLDSVKAVRIIEGKI